MNLLANQDLAKWSAVILIGLITFGYRLSFISCVLDALWCVPFFLCHSGAATLYD